MPLFEGVGPRIAKRLIELKYVRADGKPDVRRFCLEHGYDKTMFYYWLRDRSTPMKEQARLARDLKATPRWLIFGDEVRGAVKALVIGIGLALGLALGSIQSAAGTLPVGESPTDAAHYVNFRRRRDRHMYNRWPAVHSHGLVLRAA